MRKISVLLFSCILLLNCPRIEAKTRRHIKIAEINDSIISDSINYLSKDSLIAETHSGIASWYSYRGGLFAASTKFKKGSILRVINKVNNKFVDVVVNDYGPDKKKHPNRIIDLDKIAFQKIAQLRSGIINIIVLPLKIM
jgi:rare lipoprotein A (peptidoglycan hydrolase)